MALVATGDERIAMEAQRSSQDRALFWVFLALFLALVLLIVINVLGAPRTLNLARDSNIPAMYNSVLLLGIGATCLSIYALATRWRRIAFSAAHIPRFWLWVGIAFLYFSIDEAVMIHERVANNVFQAMGIWDKIVGGEITYALWEALYAPIFGGVCLMMLILLFRHRRAYPWSLWVGLAAIGSWGLALLMEFVGLTFFWQDQDLFIKMGYVEEASEIMGSTLFLLAVALVLRGTAGWDRRRAGRRVSVQRPAPSDAF